RKVFVSTCLILLLSLSIFDGYGIDGLVPLIQQHYTINDTETAIIKETASISQTIMLTLVWIFGDSFKRRRLFFTSVAAWIALSFLSILLGNESFMIFVIFRSLATAASGVFEVLTPVILADMFTDRALGIALTCLSVTELAAQYAFKLVNVKQYLKATFHRHHVIYCIKSIGTMLYLVIAKSTIRNVHRSNHGVGSIISGALGVLSIKSCILLTAASAFEMFSKKAFMFWFPTMLLIVWKISRNSSSDCPTQQSQR
ncbi:hypothetical protein PENTCL1PPCAC_3334, partial [Pristionchus entomophagus]